MRYLFHVSFVGRRNLAVAFAPTVTTGTRNGSSSSSGSRPNSARTISLVYEHRQQVTSCGLYGNGNNDDDDGTGQVYPKAYQRIITDVAKPGRRPKPVWQEVTRTAIQTTGGEPTTADAAPLLTLLAVARKQRDVFLSHFLPVGYPSTVAPYYRAYAFYTWIASIAGSASMVLSTQTLLFAIGVVGTAAGTGTSPNAAAAAAAQAGILAGAINWVLKDGLSQAGAIAWTSVAARNYDEHPKTWRMVAAIALDLAAAMELATPFLVGTRGAVLAAACTAGTLKNIGFLTASASRAAIHQALTQNGKNLADVTAKAGSQSIVAGLIGTGLGLAASHILQGRPDIVLCYSGCFIGLATIHQSFNYLAVRSIAFNRLNLQRASLVLDRFIRDGTVLDPVQVSQQEPILLINLGAWSSEPDTQPLQIGVGIMYHPKAICNNDVESRFLLSKTDSVVYLTFMTDASPLDQIVALYQALLLQKGLSLQCAPPVQDLLIGLAKAQWDLQGTDLEPRAESTIRISVGG